MCRHGIAIARPPFITGIDGTPTNDHLAHMKIIDGHKGKSKSEESASTLPKKKMPNPFVWGRVSLLSPTNWSHEFRQGNSLRWLSCSQTGLGHTLTHQPRKETAAGECTSQQGAHLHKRQNLQLPAVGFPTHALFKQLALANGRMSTAGERTSQQGAHLHRRQTNNMSEATLQAWGLRPPVT